MRHLVACVALALAACASPAAAPAGGIEGTVTAGPTCPVEIQGSPCPPQVWTGTVRATAPDGAEHETQTDASGLYRLALEPGTYTVVPVIEGSGPPIAKPVSVTVGDVMQTLDLQVDTGIR
jgi:carboxypeptidase family protein